MFSSLVETRPKYRSRLRPRKRNSKSVPQYSKQVDAATLAASIQLQQQQRELVYSLIALVMKIGLLLIGTTSLFKLGMASHQRVGRYTELSSILEVESVTLIGLQERFDRFFTIGGDRRLMNENDQWIAPNRIRIIWR